MKYFLTFLSLFLLLLASPEVHAQNPQPAREWAKLYGDSLDQRPHKVKAFGDGVYVAGETTWNGSIHGTFSKFDPATGNLLWHFRMNVPSSFSDFEWDAGQDLFIVVGGTQPFSASVDNKSLAVLVDDTGIAQRVREFDFVGREGFTTIVRHPSPPNPAFPYFVLGGKNPATNFPSSFDEPILLNLDLSLFENWEHEFMGPFVNGAAIEIEAVRGLVPLSNGQIMLLGNGSVANEGVVIIVDALTGAPVNSIYYPDFIDFYDGVELPNGEIALAGERFQSREAIVLIIEPANYTPVAGLIFNDVRQFTEIGLGNPATNGGDYPLFAVGPLKNGPQTFNYLHKISYAPGNGISLDYARYLPATAMDFSNPHLSVTPAANRIFYADSRVETGITPPSREMFVGNFTLDFDPECMLDVPSPHLGYTVNPTGFQIRFRNKINGTDQFGIPITQPLPFACNSHCVPAPVCPADFSFETDCCEGAFTSNASGIAPFTYSWDMNCDGVSDGIGNVPNFNYVFPGPGTYQVCLTITDATGCANTVQKAVTVTDDPPAFNCVNVVIPTDPDECFATYMPVIDVTDDCTPDLRPVCTFSGAITGTGAIDSFPKGITTVNCAVEDNKGQLARCQFTITVEDRQPPKIVCPAAPAPVTVPGCEGGARVFWPDPVFSDNCPMASVTSTHRPEDFFECGTTMVTYTVTDMAGLTSNCSFPVRVNCECAELAGADMRCTDEDNLYDWNVKVNDLTGASPSNCQVSVSTTQSGINLSNVVFSGGVLTGTIGIPAAPIPTTVQLSVRVECFCPDGTSLVCVLPLTLTVPCCKEISIDDQEQCRATDKVRIDLIGCNALFDVRQVRYYVSDAPCTPGAPMTLIQVSQDCRPLELAPRYHAADVCVYAEVDMGPGAGPCRQLRTDTALVRLCSPVTGTLADQTFCYAGTPITPAPFRLSVSNPDSCAYTVQWFDGGTLIPGATGLNYQPSAQQLPAGDSSCQSRFDFAAEITSTCGVERVGASIILDNNDAPTGEIVLLAPDRNPLCYGEDAILEYRPNCEQPGDRWMWENRTATTVFKDITTNGNQNPLYQTNRLYEDQWYRIAEQNGVCQVDTVRYFLDVIDPLAITSFTATYGPPCRPTRVDLRVDWTPGFTAADSCGYKLVWYKDGNAIHTETALTGPRSFAYVPAAGVPISGNYYVEIFSNCCDQAATSTVITLDPPTEVLVAGPCFRCKDESFTLSGIVLNPPAGETCTYQWYRQGSPIPGATGIDLVVQPGWYGPFLFEVICTNGCKFKAEYVLKQCGPGATPIMVSTSEVVLLRSEIYPNPTNGRITIELEETTRFGQLDILSVNGRRVRVLPGTDVRRQRFTADLGGLPAGVYVIRAVSDTGELLVVKVVKE